MEKGATHLDWMVSMGLFIVFLLSIFMIFKPGAEKAYGGDYLMSIVEKNLKEGTHYAIERIPISATVNTGNLGENIQYVRLELADKFPICEDAGKFKVIDSSFNEVSEFRVLSECNGERNGYVDVPLSLVNDNKLKFHLLYSDEFDNGGGNLDCVLESNEGGPDINCVKNIEGVVGVSEIFNGINSDKLALMKDKIDSNYNITGENNIKSKWKYPKSKNFKICFDGSSDSNCHPNDDIVKIPDDANVFAKEIKENVLEEDTTLGSNVVDINIRVW